MYSNVYEKGKKRALPKIKRLLLYLSLLGGIAGGISGCGVLIENIPSSAYSGQKEISGREEASGQEEFSGREEASGQEEFSGKEEVSGQEEFSDREEVLSQEEILDEKESLPPGSGTNPVISSVITGNNDISVIAERVLPSLVSINSTVHEEVTTILGQSRVYEGLSSGSGIIIGKNDTELLIVTNNHVVEGAVFIEAVFIDNESAEAHIKGTNSQNDLAVIAVKISEIPGSTKNKIAIGTMGDSDSLKVGQGVIAIGNALGYGQSVTVGYISALNREVRMDEYTTQTLIQTDAAINPGNSGGALINMQGEIIGINSAKRAENAVEGMGYAIPITRAWEIISDLMEHKTRVLAESEKQGYLGILGKDLSSRASRFLGIPQGVCINKIFADGAAVNSSLQEDDVITAFDGQAVRSVKELKKLLVYYEIGDCITVTVQSPGDGEYVERQVEITLGNKPNGKEKDGLL